MDFARKFTTRIIAAVLTILAVAVSVVAYHYHPSNMLGMVESFTFLLGIASVVQTFPLAGTFPTSAQAFDCNTQINRCVFADTDTTLTLTHNWGLSVAQLAQFLPLISFYIQNPGVSYPVVSFALTDSNTVTMAKTIATGSGGTFVVIMLRPLSSTL